MTYAELLEAKHEPEVLRPIAEAYWRVMLVYLLIGVVAIIALSVWEFRMVMSKITAQGDVGSTPIANVLDKAQLVEVLQKFEERKMQYGEKSVTAPTVVDPSVK